MTYQTLLVQNQGDVCLVRLNRPEANNAINPQLLQDMAAVLAVCESEASIVVLEGLPDVFCSGADFHDIRSRVTETRSPELDPRRMYEIWLQLATGPYVTVAHVRGKVNAGGIGFVAACDLVLANSAAQFSLSELLFGLYPACVFPFLARRVGFQRAHYMTLTSQTIGAEQACTWGLVDACDAQSEALLRRHIVRLNRLSKTAIGRYKQYSADIPARLAEAKSIAVAGNMEVFSDQRNIDGIVRYQQRGIFPWEA